MKHVLLQEKYPIFVTDISKSETTCLDVGDMCTCLKAMILENPKVNFIGLFDHYAHTKAIGGEIGPAIQAAVNVLFCFGPSLPSPRSRLSATWKHRAVFACRSQ